MAKAVVTYDRELPEVKDRQPHLPPTAHLRKKPETKDEWEEVSGRRPTQCLLVEKLRAAVDQWRADNYPGASDVTKRLIQFWFEQDHLVRDQLFRYYFGQREAVETVAYLVEVAGIQDAKPLVDRFATAAKGTLLAGVVHQTTMDGTRQIRRYYPELQKENVQDLPAENLRRYACKMATGSGKTVVMAMLMVWSHFHRKMVKGSDLSSNFLVVAPNVIVYQRLEKDFGSNRIFHELPLIPPEWKGRWNQRVILRGEAAEPDTSGNLFLTNIHPLYEGRGAGWTPANAVDALLGRKPAQDLSGGGRSMLDRIKGMRDLVVFNDEAHHVHDQELEWHKTLMAIHEALPGGLALWVDFTATPKDQNGTYFPWIVCDYPLAQAVEDRIVKAPLIVHKVSKEDPEKVTAENVAEKYGDWLRAAIKRWKVHTEAFSGVGVNPVLFIMAEKNAFADAIAEWMRGRAGGGFKEDEVLIIHTDKEGDITKATLEEARKAARDVDSPENKVRVIVSVLMLREGWDVRNVTVVLGLRPFTAKAKILPEQAVGRGLRLMEGIGPDRTQTLEVMGTAAFEEFVRQLEIEGVGIRTVTDPPPPPIRIEPVQEKLAHDIAIPITKPAYFHDVRKLGTIDPKKLEPIFAGKDLDEATRVRLRMEFATTGTEVHEEALDGWASRDAREYLAGITNEVIARARLTTAFAEVYPIVREYVAERCFGAPVTVESEKTRKWLSIPAVQEGIARFLARKIGEATAERREIEFESPEHRLSDTTPFTWRRKHLVASKTVFNYVASFNNFESEFAQFLETQCRDVPRFASLGTTEQDSGTRFRIDYLKPSGAIGFYHPDWVVVQRLRDGSEINWIVETKGRVWPDTAAKDAAVQEWCRVVGEQTGTRWMYVRVNQTAFRPREWRSFQDVLVGCGLAPAADTGLFGGTPAPDGPR